MASERRTRLLEWFVAGLFILLCAAVLKNIAYPLLWNDEGETAMYGRRILEYGFPKVHDGKNTVYLLELPQKNEGIDARTDAYVGSVWVQYYVAAFGELFARHVKDIYAKTALLRLPFAILGLTGILFIGLAVRNCFSDKKSFLIFLVLFFLLELTSVSLALHLKEVRYYAPSIFFFAASFYLFQKRMELSKTVYIAAQTAVLFLMFNTFATAYFPLAAALFIFEAAQKFLTKRSWKESALLSLPVFLSAALVLPVFVFFKVLYLSHQFREMFPLLLGHKLRIFLEILIFLTRYELLYPVVILRIAALSGWWTWGRGGRGQTEEPVRRRFRASNFLSLFVLLYFVVLMQVPLPYIYERYFILLQPAFMLILLLDSFFVIGLIQKLQLKTKRPTIAVFVFVIALLAVSSSGGKIEVIPKRVYELFHIYRGPLDYAVPFILSQYEDPKNLVIATNYEEAPLMYYLGSKVTIGYPGNNIEEDMKWTPDILMIRKRGAYTNHLFGTLLSRANYRPYMFSIYDSKVNNIPEMEGIISHSFKTKLAQKPEEALVVFLKHE